MTIVISKQEIFNEVEKRSSLEGVMLPELFENVWASKDDGKFLDSYWIEGYTAVIQLLKRYLKNESVFYTIDSYEDNEVLNISVEMPERYNTLLDGSVSTDVKMLIACNVLHGWLEIKAPQASAKYQEEAKGYSEDLRVKLLYRVEPTERKLSHKDMCGEIFINPEWEYINKARPDNVILKQSWGRCTPCECESDREKMNLHHENRCEFKW